MVSRPPLALAARKSGTVTGFSSPAAMPNLFPLPLPLPCNTLTGADIEILPFLKPFATRGRGADSWTQRRKHTRLTVSGLRLLASPVPEGEGCSHSHAR